MYTAPPIVPGIPLAHSKPLKLLFAKKSDKEIKLYPASTVKIVSSSFKLFNLSSFITMPLKTSSLTKMLLPFPNTLYLTLYFLISFNKLIKASTFFGEIKNLQVPPVLYVVKVLKDTSSFII